MKKFWFSFRFFFSFFFFIQKILKSNEYLTAELACFSLLVPKNVCAFDLVLLWWSFSCLFQVSVGRVYDSVLVAAEGIKIALRNGVALPSNQTYRGFCSSSDKQEENTSGEELTKYLNEVKVPTTCLLNRTPSYLICKNLN